jgi:hypothetical protein
MINEIDKPLAKLEKKKRQKTQINEMVKFLDAYDVPKLNQENINHLNTSTTTNEIKVLKKSLPTKESP